MGRKTTGTLNKEKIVPGCKGCLKVDSGGKTCVAFKEPHFQHRNGNGCYGYVSCPDEIARVAAQMQGYARGLESYRSRLAETLLGVD